MCDLIVWFLTLHSLNLQRSHYELLNTCLVIKQPVRHWSSFPEEFCCNFDGMLESGLLSRLGSLPKCIFCTEFTLNTCIIGPILADSLYVPFCVDVSTSACEILHNRYLDIFIHCQSIYVLKFSFWSSYFYGTILVTVKHYLLICVILILIIIFSSRKSSRGVMAFTDWRLGLRKVYLPSDMLGKECTLHEGVGQKLGPSF